MAQPASASVGYTVKSCYPYTVSDEAKLTVSTWLNDARTVRTYHYRLVASGADSSPQSFSVRNVQRNGNVIGWSDSAWVIDGFYSTTYTGASTIKGVVQEYNWGVPTVNRSCSLWL